MKYCLSLTFLLICLSANAGTSFLKFCGKEGQTEKDKETISSILKSLKVDTCFKGQLKLNTMTDFYGEYGKIHSLEPFKDLVDLEQMRVTGDIEDLSPLANLKKLWMLEVLKANVKDLSPLKGLMLGMLDISNAKGSKNKVKSLAPIVHMYRLLNLTMTNQDIENITPLMGLGNLQHLDLTGNYNIQNLTAIRYLSQLKYFRLRCEEEEKEKCRNKNINKTTQFFNTKEMEELFIEYAGLKDISFFENMTKLKSLHLRGNDVEDLSVLSKLHNLENIYLTDTKVTNFDFLKGLKKVKYFEANNSKYSDLSLFIDKENLKMFNCANCEIKDASALLDWPFETGADFYINDNKINSLKGFEKLHKYIHIRLDGNPVFEKTSTGECPLESTNRHVSISCIFSRCPSGFTKVINGVTVCKD